MTRFPAMMSVLEYSLKKINRNLLSSVTKIRLLSSELSQDQSSGLAITKSCADRIVSVASIEEFLRIEVEGGGCSGFQYKFHLDSKLQEDDSVFEKNGYKVVVDETSLQLIRGSTVDFREELIRNSFCITSNPQAEKECSCVSSFTLKLDWKVYHIEHKQCSIIKLIYHPMSSKVVKRQSHKTWRQRSIYCRKYDNKAVFRALVAQLCTIEGRATVDVESLYKLSWNKKFVFSSWKLPTSFPRSRVISVKALQSRDFAGCLFSFFVFHFWLSWAFWSTLLSSCLSL